MVIQDCIGFALPNAVIDLFCTAINHLLCTNQIQDHYHVFTALIGSLRSLVRLD